MKGKFKIICAILFMAVAITAGVFINLDRRNDVDWVEAANVAGEEFSFADENDIIMSVEKVLVKTSANPSENDWQTPLYTNNEASEETKKMLIRNDGAGDEEIGTAPAYYFVDVPNNETEHKNDEKYVVFNNEYVKLNNVKGNVNGEDSYFVQTSQTYYDKDRNTVEMAEAVMISLGQYFRYSYSTSENPVSTDAIGLAGQSEKYYKGEDASVTDDNFGANLTYIEINAFHNGEKIDNLPALRNYGAAYRDFVWIIPQVDGGDGLYSFSFKYMYNNQLYVTNFSFYLLFNTDYEGTVSDGNGEYSLRPTLSNAQLDGGSGKLIYRYFLGKDEATVADGVVEFNGYPTLTFDYTKYAFSYSMTANGVTNDYRYSFATNGNGISRTAMYNCTVNGSDVVSYPLGNYISVGSNIVVFVFTEMGDYTFNFEYIYSGYGANSAPSMNLPIDGVQLSIHGFELNYSATVNAKAQMRHLTLANLAPTQDYVGKINVGLIVPNGYEYGKATSGENLGVVYTLCETQEGNPNKKGVGSLLGYEGADSIGWGNELTGSGETSNNIDVGEYIVKSVDEEGVPTAYVDFVKTNQGAILLNTNDAYGDGNSFYFYATSKEDLSSNDLEAENYSNQTAFSKIGFYLVFINVQIASVADSGADYYQIFAFEYTADTANVLVEEVAADGTIGEVIGSDGYTNKNVRISWQQPSIFERKISVNYYRVLGEYLSKEELLTTTKFECNENPTIVGREIDNIQTGSKGAKYLIELVCENKSAIYRTFTIDRDPITGIVPYLVERVGNTIYRFARRQDGALISLENDVITNSIATLFWNDKPSGAEINAKYSFTPLSYKDVEVGEINFSNNAGVWYTTKYGTGNTVDDLEFHRASSLGVSLDAQRILTAQGIYLFTLTDKAGNSVKYLFVIDKTEGYFKIQQLDANGEVDQTKEAEFRTGESVLFTNDILITLGSHKVVNLNGISSDSELNKYIQYAINSQTANAQANNYYYTQNSNYLSAIRSLFAQYNGGYYLTVRNRYVHIYDDLKAHIDTISLQSNRSISIKHSANSASTIRLLFLVGVNQTYIKDLTAQNAITNYSEISASNSNLMVEINTDHSLGMAFYSNSLDVLRPNNVANNGLPQQGLTRLAYTGSKTDELSGTHATGNAYLAFTWLIGTGTDYEIGEVNYKFYELDLTGLPDDVDPTSFVQNKYYYFVNRGANTQTLYSDSRYSAGVYNNGTRAMAILNVENNQTKAGLYVVTRTYLKNIETSDEELDSTELSYYFIVDRNEIIASGVEINGGSISVGLKDNEYKFHEFNTLTSGTQNVLSYVNDATNEDISIPYNLYLQTNRLPAVLNIPVGKYFYEENGQAFGSEYYAGKLNFSVYYRDYFGQLPANAKGVIKLFESNVQKEGSNGYYELNFADLISQDIKNLFIYTDSYGNSNENYWLCLPGDYVVVISDNVEGESHQKVIGFRIFGDEDSAPTTDIYATYNENQETMELANNETKTLVTNEEFVVIDLYNGVEPDLTKAQLDLDYLLVEQIYNGNSATYIEYRHTNNSGHNIDAPTDEPGSVNVLWERDGNLTTHRKILLDTMLRKADGTIDLSNIDNTLEYRVTVRYNVSLKSNEAQSTEGLDRYKNCYYYCVDGEIFTYYENTYTIIIDRAPPKENIDMLENSDALIEYYMPEGEDSLFEIECFENPASMEFGKKYKNSFNSNDVYALYVNSQTPFDNSDVETVYFKQIVNPSNLNLTWPQILETGGYTGRAANEINSYSQIGGLQGGQFYEILEQDRAGNMSQYVIFYDDRDGSFDNLNLRLKASLNVDGIVQEEQDITLSIANNEQEILTIFDISVPENGEIFSNYSDLFYRFELKSVGGTTLHAINTTFTTGFDGEFASTLINEIIKAEGQGNYNLVLRSRTNTKTYNLNYYTEVKELNINDIIVDQGEGDDYEFLYLDLAGANIVENGITYYATEIRLKDQTGNETIYLYDNSTSLYYYLQNDERVYVRDNKIYKEVLSGTYTITMIDVFGREQSTSFNTEEGRTHYIRFGAENESDEFVKDDNKYYSYNQARVIFATGLYDVTINYAIDNASLRRLTDSTFIYEGQTIIETIIPTDVQQRSQIIIHPYFPEGKLTGALVHVIVTLNGANGGSYEVYIDSNVGAVSLRDVNGVEAELKADINAEPQTTTFTKSYAGVMNLIWSLPNKSYEPYTYRYSLQETMKDETVKTILFESDVFSHIINTTQESTGVYRFIVEIFANDDQSAYLGNKVYTFCVQSAVDELFCVTLENNMAIKDNSQFKFADFKDVLDLYRQDIIQQLYPGTRDFSYDDLISDPYNYPLYIVSVGQINIDSPLTAVRVAEGTNLKDASWKIKISNNYAFYVHRIYTDTFSIYLGILEVQETDDLVYNLAINNNALNTAQNLNYTFSENVEYTLTGLQNKPNAQSNSIINKNSILITVYCNGEFLEQYETQSAIDGSFEYVIKGNGQYSFEFADMAGNVHLFTVTTSFSTSQSSQLNIYIMREIVLLTNGANSVDNAYYNGSVEISLLNPALYDTGSITLYSCQLNGAEYKPQIDYYNQVYTFSDYGSYRVEFRANHDGELLKKVLVFTIVNVNEVSSSFDLTNVLKYRVGTVLNNAGTDITDELLSILMSNENANQCLLTYQMLLDYADLGTSFGKQKITITYYVEDGIYPVRELMFAFTLNNQTPTIDCNVQAGDKTTKGFTITFNTKVIYEQVGDSRLYINDIVVADINEESAANGTSQTYTVTFKANGAGDYYVMLKGYSGTVHTAFVVTVKEPLNTASIIIIVVVVLVVGAVIGIIIFLRTRMKIR